MSSAGWRVALCAAETGAIVGAEDGCAGHAALDAETGATVGAGLGPGSAIIGGAETVAVCATVGANMTAARAVGAVEG